MSSKPSPRVVLITGSSSGFGRQLIDIALANGDNVVATLRKPEVLRELQDSTPSDRLLVLKLDVTKKDEILDAFTKAKEKATPDDAARTLFETNFWGSTRVSQEAVRFFREENPKGAGGRLIVISSIAGLNAYAGVGFYSATKYASEAITQALAREIDPTWNIKISLVEPGNFRTEAFKTAPRFPVPEIYLAPTSGFIKETAQFAELAKPDFKTGDAYKASQKLYELSTVENPPLRLVLGQDAIGSARGHLEGVLNEITAYESWSADLSED
ncbi:hypothetical protein BC629DRAFT_1596333 [Irpex lacteus]|nr:hypothetical protein BC629DRAFT_1596333 [Irpex lacteus]